jgi:hypothetical protein
LCCFREVRSTPLFNHGRSSYGASHRRFQVLQALVQVAGILLKRILQNHTFQDLSLMLGRSLCCFSWSGETTPLFNHGRSSYSAPTASSTASFGSGSWYTLKRILQEPYHSRPFVVMLRRSLCCFREGETTPLFNHGRSSYGASHRRFQVLQLRFR